MISGAEIIFSIILIFVAFVFIGYYKWIIPIFQGFQRLFTVLIGTFMGLLGFIITYLIGMQISRGREIDIALIIFSFIVGLIFATPSYLISRLVMRIEELEKK